MGAVDVYLGRLVRRGGSIWEGQRQHTRCFFVCWKGMLFVGKDGVVGVNMLFFQCVKGGR